MYVPVELRVHRTSIMLNLITGCFKLVQLRSISLFVLEFRENLCFCSQLYILWGNCFIQVLNAKFDSEKLRTYAIVNLCIATNGKQFVLDHFHLSEICPVLWLSNCTNKHGLWFNRNLTIYNVYAIFDAASVHCLGIGMQCHGCCIL